MLECVVCKKEIAPGDGRVISGERLAASLQVTYELAKGAGLEEAAVAERLSELRGSEEHVICSNCSAVVPNLSRPKQYWRANMKLIAILLAIWAIVSYGCSILFIEQLNQFKIGELPLGFWFSQQGSIFVFVILVFVYAFAMDRLDRRFDVKE